MYLVYKSMLLYQKHASSVMKHFFFFEDDFFFSLKDISWVPVMPDFRYSVDAANKSEEIKFKFSYEQV